MGWPLKAKRTKRMDFRKCERTEQIAGRMEIDKQSQKKVSKKTRSILIDGATDRK